jgi:peptide/nickel transport system ATP-binding protein
VNPIRDADAADRPTLDGPGGPDGDDEEERG